MDGSGCGSGRFAQPCVSGVARAQPRVWGVVGVEAGWGFVTALYRRTLFGVVVGNFGWNFWGVVEFAVVGGPGVEWFFCVGVRLGKPCGVSCWKLGTWMMRRGSYVCLYGKCIHSSACSAFAAENFVN